MRFPLGVAFVVCATALWAQSQADPEVARAQAGIERLRELVQAGAAPRAQLERAEAAIADAQDAAFLRHTLYGPDLNEEQSEEMVAAARRRLERRQRELEKAEQLVQEGVASRFSLGTFLEELDQSRKQYDLALSRARLAHELAEMAKAEQVLQNHLEQSPAEAHQFAQRYEGNGFFTLGVFRQIEAAYESRFAKPLPVSAMGETAVHRALGFDHRNRVDVALNPDQPEGLWLRRHLEENRIPYFAFRQAVRGKATGAHIHIGPMSLRLASGG